MRETLGNIAVSVATNTALFTGLDLGQKIADAFSLWMLPANLVAAVIATAFGRQRIGARGTGLRERGEHAREQRREEGQPPVRRSPVSFSALHSKLRRA